MTLDVDDFVSRASEVGVDVEVERFPECTRTAEDAADALGCGVEQIVKSLVFVVDDEDAVVVYTAGDSRVDEDLLKAELDAESLRTASPEEVEEYTGYPVGAVPPFGLRRDLEAFVDPKLLERDRVWAGAGAADAVFAFDPGLLENEKEADDVDVFE